MPPRTSLFPYTTLFRSPERIFALRLVAPADGDALVRRKTVTVLFAGLAGGGSSGDVEVRQRATARALEEMQAVIERHGATVERSEEHTSELQSQFHLVCRRVLLSFPTRRSSDLPSGSSRCASWHRPTATPSCAARP